LPINFAQTGHPVLLIDADLRNPSLHKSLGTENSRGLSNYLSGDLPVLAGVRTTSIPNLFMIPTGPLPPNPVEFAVGTQIADVADATRRAVCSHHHRCAAGAGPGRRAGARQPGRRRALRRGCRSSKKAHSKVALKRLRLAGVSPIGAVMTKVDLRDGMYGYESAYYYYGSTNEIPALPKA